MMKEEARLDLCIHHVAEQSLLSSYQRSPHHITHSLSPTKISTTRALTINQSNSLLDSERETIQESGPRISCFSISIFSLNFFGWRRCPQLGMTRLMRRGCGTIGLELKVWLWEVPNLDLICLFDTLLQSRENLWKQFPIVKSCKTPC